MKDNHFSEVIGVFHERIVPEEGYIVGYAALMNSYDLHVPVPDMLSIISHKHKRYQTQEWRVFTPRYMPEDSLIGHLTFALKYEGIELGLLKQLFITIPVEEWLNIISIEPNGQYSRKIWFLYEWLINETLDLPDMTAGNYIDLVDTSIQFGLSSSINSKRHRVRNNLLGSPDFCPMIRKTAALERYMELQLSREIKEIIGGKM